MNVSVPQTVYKTPEPEENVSELYTIYCQQMPDATTRGKCWIVKERYGAWDGGEPDPKKKFKIGVTTLSPTDPRHYLTADEAEKQADAQVLSRAKSGFKYLFVRNFYEAPWHKRYEILPDGKLREIPMK